PPIVLAPGEQPVEGKASPGGLPGVTVEAVRLEERAGVRGEFGRRRRRVSPHPVGAPGAGEETEGHGRQRNQASEGRRGASAPRSSGAFDRKCARVHHPSSATSPLPSFYSFPAGGPGVPPGA